MKPTPHPRRASSPAAPSRCPVDALIYAKPMPIGIPAYFLADQLLRGRSAEQIFGAKTCLLAEYAGAEGYAYGWGHLIEQRLGCFVLWRVVPVALWERLSPLRAGSPLLIEDVVTLVQPEVYPALAPHLPAGVLLTSCQGQSRRSPHGLFALLLSNPGAETVVRHWLATRLLTDLVPTLLNRVERRVEDYLRVRTS
jgi:hypothetical protein